MTDHFEHTTFEYDPDKRLKLTKDQWKAYYLWNTANGPHALNEIIAYGCSENEWAERQERYHGNDQSVTLNLFSKDSDVITRNSNGTYRVSGSTGTCDQE